MFTSLLLVLTRVVLVVWWPFQLLLALNSLLILILGIVESDGLVVLE